MDAFGKALNLADDDDVKYDTLFQVIAVSHKMPGKCSFYLAWHFHLLLSEIKHAVNFRVFVVIVYKEPCI